MANEPRGRQSRATATPQNSAAMGVILVIAAAVIALLLFNAGGGTSTASDDGKTPAESANGSTTTSTIPTAVTAAPGNLEVVVGNGSGAAGRAKVTTEKLAPLGYTNTKYVDANSSPTTIIYFSPGHDADALALAQVMGLGGDRVQPLPAQSPLKEAVPTAALTVVVGTDFDPATAPFTAPTTPTN